ncbi:polysaccharide biosynthesis protein [Pseudogemmatithrix spongiicola]|uniref:UDP-glucose 4-epimerase n=1 Tax=Pseudogemmatithrix spongiicola TaxID=3062599 RepID=A0AA49Q766_9BACT|nr:polysaccharide biosynthesis protein [Gemmatimonadaceae bacterium 'strain 138']WKW15388.1 polysaccharide biosynthesis protein [Gemmatimonadaceae bacterium 'strain 318']
MFESKRILITGGTGSFGNAVLRRALADGVKEVRVFSRDEKKQEDMRLALNDDRVRFFIGDVREPRSLTGAMTGVELVFSAAALKQVPSCEFYPMEAVRTNILGTENVLDAALAAGVKRVVVLSTDKAVYPINAMGISKAMAEKLVVAKSRVVPEGSTVYCATRYGNVMASRGSVIPLFIKQIKAGEPITVTDPLMTRFLMSLDESVELVGHAFQHGRSGDLFVQKAPASTVGDLAEALMQIFGKRVPLRTIGTRHGEKLHETLVSREERSRSVEEGRYFRISPDDRDLNYKKYFVEGQQEVSALDDYTSANTERLDVAGVVDTLMRLDYVRDELHA